MSDSLAENDLPPKARRRRPLQCVRCGYSLRGLARDGVCPECSLPVDTSLRAGDLRIADPEFLRVIRRGARTNLISAALVAIAFLVFAVAGWLSVQRTVAGLSGLASDSHTIPSVSGSIVEFVLERDGSVTQHVVRPDGAVISAMLRPAIGLQFSPNGTFNSAASDVDGNTTFEVDFIDGTHITGTIAADGEVTTVLDPVPRQSGGLPATFVVRSPGVAVEQAPQTDGTTVERPAALPGPIAQSPIVGGLQSDPTGAATRTVTFSRGTSFEVTTQPSGDVNVGPATFGASTTTPPIGGGGGVTRHITNTLGLAWLVVITVLVPLGWWWITARHPIHRLEQGATARRVARIGAVGVPTVLLGFMVMIALMIAGTLGPGQSSIGAWMFLAPLSMGGLNLLGLAAWALLYFAGFVHVGRLGRALHDRRLETLAKVMLWAPLVGVSVPVVLSCAGQILFAATLSGTSNIGGLVVPVLIVLALSVIAAWAVTYLWTMLRLSSVLTKAIRNQPQPAPNQSA